MSSDGHSVNNEPKLEAPRSNHVEEKSSDDEGVQQTGADGTVNYVDKHAIGGDLEGMPKGYYRSPQFIGTVVAQCFASIAAYLGWVLPANTLSLINADLGNSPNINWVATVWTLGSCIGFLLVGRLSDIFGRKWMVLSTSFLGLIGCIIGSAAQNVEMLIGANVCNGLAAAGQLSFGIVLGELVPNKMRGPIVSIVFLSSLPFAVFGPIVARTFIETTANKWRWSYFLGDIINFIAIVLYYFLYHPPTYDQLHLHGKTRRQAVKELDWIGMFLFIAGCVLFLVGLSWGGSLYAWDSAHVLSTLLIGFATLASFVVYEAYFCKTQPLMPPRLFRNIGFVAIVLVATIGSMIYYSLTVLWPTIIGSIYTTDSTEIGWQSSVVGGGVLLGQAAAGVCLSYVPKVKIQTITASLIAAAFITSMISLSPDRHDATLAIGVIACTAIGFVENITFPGVTLVWEPQDIGLATGVLGSIRALGGAIAQSLYVTVLTNKLNDYLPENVIPAATEAGLPESSIEALFAGITAGDFSTVKGMTPEIAAAVGSAVRTSYVDAFKMVFYTTVPFSAILIIAACFVPNMEKYLTKNVAKRLQDQNLDKEEEKKIEKV
ncbi:trichothecene efflux pump [Zalerion maritima]|uniref:Trichothecene efflux pump n=1 Tax=Zalerion maritima TaxID=339359 RepID=A0AAD5RXM2_9PEZI|nr:trichothecene efflux pump [Zalerion maritima]